MTQAEEIERLRRALDWCRMRLKQDAYRERLDRFLADPSCDFGPSSAESGLTLVQSRERERIRQILADQLQRARP